MGLLQALQPLNQYVLQRHEEKGLLARAREERAARERELAAQRDDQKRGFLLSAAKDGYVPQGGQSLASRLAPDLAADPLAATSGTGIAASLLQRANVGGASGLLAPRGADGTQESLVYDATQDRDRMRDVRTADQRRAEQEAERRAREAADERNFGQQKTLLGIQHGHRLSEIGAQNAGDVARVQAAAQAKPTRALPLGVMKTIAENEKQLSTIDEALQLVEGNPEAVGLRNALGLGAVRNRLPGANPSEISTRAAVADFGSMTIRDRSGAAVTAAEFPRIAPFIPSPTDNAATVKAKLARMRDIIQEEADLYRANYGPDQGFQEFRGGSARAAMGAAGATPNDTPRRYSADNPFAQRTAPAAPGRGGGRSF